MRNIISLMMVFAVGAFFLTSCGTKCDDPAATNFEEKEECVYNNLPTISDFAVTGDKLPGATLTITFIASDTEGLKSWKLETEKGGTTTEEHSHDLSGGSQTITQEYVIPQTMAADDLLVITVTVTDGNDETTSQSTTITIEAPLMEHMGQFYHIGGTLLGAYDLESNSEKAVGDPAADKDMANTDPDGATFTGSWEAVNNTLWVKDNSFDYDLATAANAETAFNAGASSAAVNNPVISDIYIGKLRGGDKYVIVKITDVSPADATCACLNPGKISFSYKK